MREIRHQYRLDTAGEPDMRGTVYSVPTKISRAV